MRRWHHYDADDAAAAAADDLQPLEQRMSLLPRQRFYTENNGNQENDKKTIIAVNALLVIFHRFIKETLCRCINNNIIFLLLIFISCFFAALYIISTRSIRRVWHVCSRSQPDDVFR